MPHRPFGRALCCVIGVSLVAIGCGRDARLPTAIAPPTDLTATAPVLDSRHPPTFVTMRGREHWRQPLWKVIAEAEAGLGGVFTSEQVYFQKWLTFTDVPDTADFRLVLGVYLGDLLNRWDFSVGGATMTGFTATARGRLDPDAEGITVTLNYQRDHPPVWTVVHRGPHRGRHPLATAIADRSP